MRAVRRADLDQPAAGARHDGRQAEAAADLDQLAARDRHLAAQRERVEASSQGGCIVVDDGRRGAAGQPLQPRFDMRVALAAPSAIEVVLEVRRAAPRPRRSPRAPARGSGARPRLVCSTVPVRLKTLRSDGVRAASMRVATPSAIDRSRITGSAAAASCRPGTPRREFGADRLEHDRPPVRRGERIDRRPAEHAVDRRQMP